MEFLLQIVNFEKHFFFQIVGQESWPYHINTQYMRNPDMVYLLKMEYVSKIYIFGLNMVVKSLEKIFLKFLHAQGLFQTS